MTPAKIRKHVAERLKRARKRARLTQQEVADAAEITRAEVSAYECGRCVPGVLVLPWLCAALGVTANSIVPRVEVAK